MAVSVIPVVCPQCGANLNIENGREYAFCSYCGAKILINNDNVHVYRTVDEASIMKAETDRIVRLRELELKEKEAKRKRIFAFLPFGVALALIILGAIISIFDDYYGSMALLWGFIVGMYSFIFAMIKHNRKNDE